MKIPRYSKSFDARVSICPWLADQEYNHGRRQPAGQAAVDNALVHEIRQYLLEDKIDMFTAYSWATSPEVAKLISWAIAKDIYYDQRDQFRYERFCAIDRNGQLTPATGIDPETREYEDANGQEFIVGFMDRIGPISDDTLLIEDMKGTRPQYEKSSWAEIAVYVVFGRLLYPTLKKLRFDYFYVRSGRRVSWNFVYNRRGNVTVTPPKGEGKPYRLKAVKKRDPIFAWITNRIAEIEAMEPVPRPGAHCGNIYGQPCAFLTDGSCPVGSNLQHFIRDPHLSVPAVREILLSPQDKASGAAFMAIANDGVTEDHITPAIASLAWQGHERVAEWDKKVQKKLKAWSNKQGPIKVGDDKVGWNELEKYVIAHPQAAIRIIMNNGGVEALAKAVNISPSSLKGLGKRKYGDLAQQIKELCGDRKTERAFGVIKAR